MIAHALDVAGESAVASVIELSVVALESQPILDKLRHAGQRLSDRHLARSRPRAARARAPASVQSTIVDGGPSRRPARRRSGRRRRRAARALRRPCGTPRGRRCSRSCRSAGRAATPARAAPDRPARAAPIGIAAGRGARLDTTASSRSTIVSAPGQKRCISRRATSFTSAISSACSIDATKIGIGCCGSRTFVSYTRSTAARSAATATGRTRCRSAARRCRPLAALRCACAILLVDVQRLMSMISSH